MGDLKVEGVWTSNVLQHASVLLGSNSLAEENRGCSTNIPHPIPIILRLRGCHSRNGKVSMWTNSLFCLGSWTPSNGRYWHGNGNYCAFLHLFDSWNKLVEDSRRCVSSPKKSQYVSVQVIGEVGSFFTVHWSVGPWWVIRARGFSTLHAGNFQDKAIKLITNKARSNNDVREADPSGERVRCHLRNVAGWVWEKSHIPSARPDGQRSNDESQAIEIFWSSTPLWQRAKCSLAEGKKIKLGTRKGFSGSWRGPAFTIPPFLTNPRRALKNKCLGCRRTWGSFVELKALSDIRRCQPANCCMML